MHTTAQGIGVGMTIESYLTVEPLASGARLVWRAEVVELKGLVASVSPGLIRAAAEQVIRDIWTRIRAHIEPAR